jgi:transposase
LVELVEGGPDPAHGVARWRVDLRDESQRRVGVTLHERSVGKVLARLGYRKLSIRPREPQDDEEVQETFKKLRRDSYGANPQPRQRQADRNLVPG